MFRTLLVYAAVTAGLMSFISSANATPRSCAEELACCDGDECAEIMDSCIDSTAEAEDLAQQLRALARAVLRVEDDADFSCEPENQWDVIRDETL